MTFKIYIFRKNREGCVLLVFLKKGMYMITKCTFSRSDTDNIAWMRDNALTDLDKNKHFVKSIKKT